MTSGGTAFAALVDGGYWPASSVEVVKRNGMHTFVPSSAAEEVGGFWKNCDSTFWP